MKKNLRQRELKRRKSFLPTLILTIVCLGALIGIIYFVDPNSVGAVPVFFILIFINLFFGFSLIFANSRRGLITSLTLSIFLILRYFGIGNILNLLLIAGITVSIEAYAHVQPKT